MPPQRTDGEGARNLSVWTLPLLGECTAAAARCLANSPPSCVRSRDCNGVVPIGDVTCKDARLTCCGGWKRGEGGKRRDGNKGKERHKRPARPRKQRGRRLSAVGEMQASSFVCLCFPPHLVAPPLSRLHPRFQTVLFFPLPQPLKELTTLPHLLVFCSALLHHRKLASKPRPAANVSSESSPLLPHLPFSSPTNPPSPFSLSRSLPIVSNSHHPSSRFEPTRTLSTASNHNHTLVL